ncbi:hypothetical protein [Campylobacter troglodytis]|uniref:hypothetical protein n=1 Tax=Campylobacter troglodytis TaxID=654363 RepID=UPI00163C3B8A|nr:hypothetical protein [Campylobacter troglodytis]
MQSLLEICILVLNFLSNARSSSPFKIYSPFFSRFVLKFTKDLSCKFNKASIVLC